MLDYQLGEMKGTNGSVLRYEVEDRAMELTISISRKIEATSIYKQLIKKLPSQRVLIYFRHIVKQEIYPFVRQACVIHWYKRNGKIILPNENTVIVPRYGISILLKEYWDFKDIPIVLVSPIFWSFKSWGRLKKLFKGYLKNFIIKICRGFNRFKRTKKSSLLTAEQGLIACHYTEGVDFSRRNDLNWYREGDIERERVLIYFDNNNIDTSSRGKLIEKKVIEYIEDRGFKWVTLEEGIIEGRYDNYWQPPKMPRDLFIDKKAVKNKVESWVMKVANDLLEQVYYWRSFYDDFNIKINYTPEEGRAKNIAQAIAFDIKNEMSGFLIGKQRSEVFLPLSSYIGHHPMHIFFIWNKRVGLYFLPNDNQNEMLIISGYPNNIFRKNENISNLSCCQKLRFKGAKFIIALFDSMYGPNYQFSMNGMAKYYQAFLQWVLDDINVGVVIKSKKPAAINNLSVIHPLLNKAIESGRCIRLDNEFGCFPSDASFGADVAVGCGISSALIEAVIGGCRGIHYDMAHLKNHEFYKWGYEKIIFDDLDRLIASLKKYKEEPRSNSELGDWTPYLNELDPFRDGKGGERMGIYFRWCLEGFDAGLNRKDVIEQANRKYATTWGGDKVIQISKM